MYRVGYWQISKLNIIIINHTQCNTVLIEYITANQYKTWYSNTGDINSSQNSEVLMGRLKNVSFSIDDLVKFLKLFELFSYLFRLVSEIFN